MDFWDRQLEAEQMKLDKLYNEWANYDNFRYNIMNEHFEIDRTNIPPTEYNDIFDDFLFEQQNNTDLWQMLMRRINSMPEPMHVILHGLFGDRLDRTKCVEIWQGSFGRAWFLTMANQKVLYYFEPEEKLSKERKLFIRKNYNNLSRALRTMVKETKKTRKKETPPSRIQPHRQVKQRLM